MSFSILSWNIQGSRYFTKTNFNKIIPFLENCRADILCLQEALEIEKKLLDLGWLEIYGGVFPKNQDNRNVILSKLPIIASGEFEFFLPAKKQLEKALWIDCLVDDKIIRIYNCHFGVVRVGPQERAGQLSAVLEDSKKHQGPAIICGDLNTVIPSSWPARKIVQFFHLQSNKSLLVNGQRFKGDERHVFKKIAESNGFSESADIAKPTWRLAPLNWELFKLKLDWFLVRGVGTEKITLGPYISDHRFIMAECLINN